MNIPIKPNLLRILFQSRTTLFSVPGGDTIQVLKTAEELKKLGCLVDISIELEPDLAGYDLVHLFNLIRPQETYQQALNAKRHGKPVVLSTIYVDYSEYDRKGRTGIARLIANILSTSQLEYLKIFARSVVNRERNKGTLILLHHGYRALQEKILAMTDMLLPNSESEMRRVIADFPECSQKPYVIVPNAVDVSLFNEALPNPDPEFDRFRGCVLCVGRIEGRKCQLELVRAMKGLPWQLVLVGKSAPNHAKYYEQILKEAGPNVHVLGHVEHEMLPDLYKAARVHCLVSWMETTGLSSLEAGAMGCNLVITDRGDTRDYFSDYAFYCQPDSVSAIRDAIIQAYDSPVKQELQTHIRQNFTWQKAAEKTLEGYRLVLGR
jgi:glycosyltransferase involved in cell wall biosynthesis